MKLGFYPKLAWDSMRRNRRMYLPYILTCVGMAAMYYIVIFLQYSPALELLPSPDNISSMLGFGGWVTAIFSCIFLFYSNSFLMKRRRREFGLYNILGMGKRNIARLLLWETLIIYVLSLLAGLAAGIALSKLAELVLINLIRGEVSFDLSVSLKGAAMTTAVFGAIFLLLLLNSLRQIGHMSAVRLLKSESEGEKPPKGNWVTGVLGVLILGAAYYIAVTIENPVAALNMFFIAVIMVIIGTYLTMISGSVLFCRILQRNKRYYYKPDHFVSVSSMAYRMKRNGAGLASICVLATMVLVMLSTTTALYFGTEDTVYKRYPREINTEFEFACAQQLSDEHIAQLRDELTRTAADEGAKAQNVLDYRSAFVAGYLDGTNVEVDVSKVDGVDMDTYSNVCQFYFIPLTDYNAVTGSKETLSDGEALIYGFRTQYDGGTIAFNGGRGFTVKRQLDELWDLPFAAVSIVPSIVLIVPDLEAAVEGLDEMTTVTDEPMLDFEWEYDFDTGMAEDEQARLLKALGERFSADEGEAEYDSFKSDGREENRADYYGLYGGIFFLGILLSVVFLFATVLIIYYKQISEGYEDSARFEIMRKVGMTRREIRRSINSQLLTVFFLPLVGAGLHLIFAFPMIRRLLMLFNLYNVELFIATTAISFLAFALFYTIIYRVTSNAYYGIVSGVREEGRA